MAKKQAQGQRTSVTLPAAMWDKIDKAAAAREMKRSEYVEYAVRKTLSGK